MDGGWHIIMCWHSVTPGIYHIMQLTTLSMRWLLCTVIWQILVDRFSGFHLWLEFLIKTNMTKLDINSVYVGFTFFSYTKKSLVYFVSLRIYYLIVYLKISPFSLSILETLEDKFNNVEYFLSEMIKPIIMLYLQSHWLLHRAL